MKILITGCAGFIGFHTAIRMKKEGHEVYGIDSFNDYYDPDLKYARANILESMWDIDVDRIDLFNKSAVVTYMNTHRVDMVIHLAAYAGVRYSIKHPQKYINNNITGTSNLIHACEMFDINKVVYASTSCVMHGNPLPWTEDEKLGYPLSPYGYSKIVNESQFMMSNIENAIGLRFFTVYGPWGRPDMALFSFCDKIVKGESIELFNYGNMKRDFTYIDDIVNGINIVVESATGKEIYNIGYGQQVKLMDFVKAIEKNLGRKTDYILKPRHPADAEETWSDTTKLQKLGYKPTTSIEHGVASFIRWYKHYYEVN